MKAAPYFMMAWCLLVSTGLQAQQRFDVPVALTPGLDLAMPWTGGFNAPQFSNIDLNRDGIQDMITFDRQGDILRTYIRMPATGRWVWAPEFEALFPDLVDWVLVADFNQDGVEDLFTSSSGYGVAGVSVYQGGYENDQWTFTRLMDRDRGYLQVPAGNGLTNLYVAWDDIPAISDIDGDGDLDMLAFEPGGSFITYFTNRSVENGWGVDSLRFDVEDICWGKILENELSETVYLSDDPQVCSDGNLTGEDVIEPRHAGSTVMAMDIDFDGDLDAFVGDITSKRIVFMRNGLTAQQAWITEQDAHFPVEDTSVNIPYFVAAYQVQVDDDPEPELIAAVNSRALTEDKVSAWRYDDDPLTDGPLAFQLQEKGFFQNDMIDMGSHTRPAVADINADGLPDLVTGGYRYTDESVTRLPSLWYFRNTGTLSQPYFQLEETDFLSMSQYASIPSFEFAPAFGDLDGNGSIDLIVGEQNGKLFYFHNKAQEGDPMDFDAAVYPFMNIAVGVSSAPQIVDINGDGRNDLVVGERTGNSDQTGRCSNLNYFENIGATGDPLFSSDVSAAPNTQCFGRVLFDFQPGLPQYSAPAIIRSREGLVMITGRDDGYLSQYTDLHLGKTGSITLVDEQFGMLDVGHRSAPALADINGDGYLDLLCGNQRGGVELFSTPFEVATTAVADPGNEKRKPYLIERCTPDGHLDIRITSPAPFAVTVYDMGGRRILHDPVQENDLIRMDLSLHPAGVYVIMLSTRHEQWVEKCVTQ